MKDNLQAAVDFFVSNPKMLEKSSGKFIKGTYGKGVFKGQDKEFVYKAKEKARKILAGDTEAELQNIIAEQEEYFKQVIDEKKGEATVDTVTTRRVKTLQDLIEVCQIDTEIWDIASWECNKWEVGRKAKKVKWSTVDGVANGTVEDEGNIFVEPLFQVKAKLVKHKAETIFIRNFEDFLKGYQPKATVLTPLQFATHREDALLVLPKQDAHYNRADIHGRNDIFERFALIEKETSSIVREASELHKLDKITYIVGSDQLNSEWNGMTTGGTPQENIMGYHKAFKLICDHEVTIIHNLLCNATSVEVLFVPGNHDEYAGWHIFNWLQCYFRNQGHIKFTEGNPDDPRRYERYGVNAIMYDHGAKLNGKQLAQKFPVEFRKEWSKCENFYIFSGDKHHEMSLDVDGIKYFRVPALTPTKSKWEHKSGYMTPGEMQAFLIKKSNKGMTNQYNRLLEKRF